MPRGQPHPFRQHLYFCHHPQLSSHYSAAFTFHCATYHCSKNTRCHLWPSFWSALEFPLRSVCPLEVRTVRSRRHDPPDGLLASNESWTLDGQLAVKKLCYLWLERDIFCEPVWWCSVLRGSFLPAAVDCIATVAIVTDLMNFERVARVVVAPWWLGIWHFCDFLTGWTQRSVGSLVILSPTRWMTVLSVAGPPFR